MDVEAVDGLIVLISVAGAILAATLAPYLTHKYVTKHDREFALSDRLWEEKYRGFREIQKRLEKINEIIIELHDLNEIKDNRETAMDARKNLFLSRISSSGWLHEGDKQRFSEQIMDITESNDKTFELQYLDIKMSAVRSMMKHSEVVHHECFSLLLILNDQRIVNNVFDVTAFATEAIEKIGEADVDISKIEDEFGLKMSILFSSEKRELHKTQKATLDEDVTIEPWMLR